MADGLDKMADAPREFFPSGWLPTKTAHEAIASLVLDDERVQEIERKAVHVKDMLASLDIVVTVASTMVMIAYTEESPLYKWLNNACRSSGTSFRLQEKALKNYLDFIFLMQKAMAQLPPFTGPTYRGVNCKLNSVYHKGQELFWHQFVSSTKSPIQTIRFLTITGEKLDKLIGTMFIMDVCVGTEVEFFSDFPKEEEVVLPTNTQWKVTDYIEDEQEKKQNLPILASYDLSGLDVYRLTQLTQLQSLSAVSNILPFPTPTNQPPPSLTKTW